MLSANGYYQIPRIAGIQPRLHAGVLASPHLPVLNRDGFTTGVSYGFGIFRTRAQTGDSGVIELRVRDLRMEGDRRKREWQVRVTGILGFLSR
jgi:hypothetical protein